jgi:uncharacterized protein (TIGR02611 family)
MSPLIWTFSKAKKLVVTIIGATVLCIGIAMIVLPGPAIVVIPIGLGILATEFVWAGNLLHKVKERLPKRTSKVHQSESGGN